MTLSDEYKRQFPWRSWSDAMDVLPSLAGKTVLDLGCSIGDQAALLAARGARVIGVDANEELLATARARKIPNAEFRSGDIRELGGVAVVDGIWCSFAAAYVPELGAMLASWKQHLNPGGWVALTEVDDLFGHEPVEAQTRSLLAAYAHEAFAANRYDFHMGRKLAGHLEQAGFTIANPRTLADKELGFDGPAGADVIEAWRSRLERMRALRAFCGPMFEQVRDDLLAALARADHYSLAKVYYCVGML